MTIVKVILLIVLVIFLLTLASCIENIAEYFSVKSDKERMLIREKEDPKFPSPKLDYLGKLQVTVSLINLINILIDGEISRLIDTLSRLNARYDLKNLDEDAKKIAESVFNGLSKEDTFLSKQLMLTDEYIMKIITEESITRLINSTYKYNNAILINK